MTITITLATEIEAQLRQSIVQRDAESVSRLLTEALRPTVEAMLREVPPGLNDGEFERLADQLAEELAASVTAAQPTLSDHAVSREGIYEDHP